MADLADGIDQKNLIERMVEKMMLAAMGAPPDPVVHECKTCALSVIQKGRWLKGDTKGQLLVSKEFCLSCLCNANSVRGERTLREAGILKKPMTDNWRSIAELVLP